MNSNISGRFCRKCGKPLTPEDEFCSSCGTQVVKEYVQNEPPPVRENPPENVPSAIETPTQTTPSQFSSIKPKYIVWGVGILIVLFILHAYGTQIATGLTGLLCVLICPLLGLSPFIFTIIGFVKRLTKRKKWEQFAQTHGFNYSKHDPIGLPAEYDTFQLFRQGMNKKAYNVCLKNDADLNFCVFDYQYVTEHTDKDGRKHRQTHYATGVLVESPLMFQSLYIQPKNILSKLVSGMGFGSIQFEWAEFSRNFSVSCDDKKFAYDIIHALMMEFLMQCPQKYNIEAHFQAVLFHRGKDLSIPEVETLLIITRKFFELIPDYVKEDYSATE